MADRIDGEASEAARRYARAIFDLAKEAKQLDAVEQDFVKFSAAWRESSELRDVARSPLIDPVDKAKALVAVAQKLGLSDLGRKAIGTVAQNRRAGELLAIGSVFRSLALRERGSRQVEVIFARQPGDQEKNAVVSALSEKLGSKIEAEISVDESLIGGFVARVGSRQFDASVKAKLDALRLALKFA